MSDTPRTDLFVSQYAGAEAGRIVPHATDLLRTLERENQQLREALETSTSKKTNTWPCKHIVKNPSHGNGWRMSGGDWHRISGFWKYCPLCGARRPIPHQSLLQGGEG